MREFLVSLILLTGTIQADQKLPVFLADNHAETFAWITRTFDVDERYQLVLIDAHTDATAAEKSEEIREQLRRVTSMDERNERCENWRETGRIQAFNWIEPLMPRPVAHVLWIAKPELTENEANNLTKDATSQLDGRLEIEPRSSGSFAEYWETRDIAGLLDWEPGDRPVILSFDLDFLAGMKPVEREEAFSKIWTRAMDWPGLCGVSFSVSRPWLADNTEADALVALACAAVARTRGTEMVIDAKLDLNPDQSALATIATKPIPRWNAAATSQKLRSIWEIMDDSVEIISRKAALPNRSSQLAIIRPDGGEIDCDGGWRFSVEDASALRIHAPYEATGKVRWFILEPARAAYDFLPQTKLGKDFSKSPARWIYEERRELCITTDFALAAMKWSLGKPGHIRVEAEVETTDGWLPVAPIDIRLQEGTGFHAALSECFRMPYGFGIAGVSENYLTAVETGWASDCSNLLIYAWRRNGVDLRWGDPGRLRRQLTTVAENVQHEDGIPFPISALEKGVMIDFGKHVAALWKDCEPFGKLDGNDLVMHHLGGFPEIVTLAALAKDRPRFAIRALKNDELKCSIKIAGDVVLASDERVVIPEFKKEAADLFIANLEGIPSAKEPKHKPRYDFRFPADRLKWLALQGVDGVSLANNHGGDAGEEGLLEGIIAIRAAGIAVFGAGKNSDEACQPWRIEKNGVKAAFFGISLVDAMTAGDDKPGVARLPEHAKILEKYMLAAKSKGERIIVMVHGGDEYKKAVTESQGEWALWLTSRGADLIAGSHPHVIQRSEFHAGARIFYSLGNAVYPKALTGADSGKIESLQLIPVSDELDLSSIPIKLSDY
jgi:poly-gamma-glutamate capsule biosynthesis protein CapA/YwtB (metallophosphatase superfamily)